MKYKLINIKTKEETLCEKVTSEGYDYYVNNTNKVQIASMSVLDFTVATTNPNSDLPKVIDEIKQMAINNNPKLQHYRYDSGVYKASYTVIHQNFIEGYKKSQSTHPFTEKDMIDFGLFCAEFVISDKEDKSKKELLNIWKNEQIKIIYYEEE